jgi:hypothetical protein
MFISFSLTSFLFSLPFSFFSFFSISETSVDLAR